MANITGKNYAECITDLGVTQSICTLLIYEKQQKTNQKRRQNNIRPFSQQICVHLYV